FTERLRISSTAFGEPSQIAQAFHWLRAAPDLIGQHAAGKNHSKRIVFAATAHYAREKAWLPRAAGAGRCSSRRIRYWIARRREIKWGAAALRRAVSHGLKRLIEGRAACVGHWRCSKGCGPQGRAIGAGSYVWNSGKTLRT